MSIRNILVAYNGTETADRAVKLATAIAARSDAHLTALFAHSMPLAHAQLDFYMTTAALDVMEANQREADARVEEQFKTLMGELDPTVRTDYLNVRGFPNDILSDYSRTYDLVVVGQPSGKTGVSIWSQSPCGMITSFRRTVRSHCKAAAPFWLRRKASTKWS